MRVVDHEAADEDEDQRRQVQRLADRVEADEAREQRQEADVAVDLVDEVVERERRGDRHDDRQRAAAEEVERESVERAFAPPATRRTPARRGCRRATIS